ncbi:MAG: MMPL family transporter [Bacteroidia bacterium]|nr:MMPL family transporter [Bacteroidia bacterium]
MWDSIAEAIIRFRKWAFVLVGIATAGISYFIFRLEFNQEFIKVVPADDPDYVVYTHFREVFGEDGNTLLVGLAGKTHSNLKTFNDLYQLSELLKTRSGVTRVLNYTHLPLLLRDDSARSFVVKPITSKLLNSQQEADSVLQVIKSQPFYRDLVFNDSYDVALFAITFSDSALNTKLKHILMREAEDSLRVFAGRNNLTPHFTGLPYVRTYMMRILPRELGIFLGLAFLFSTIAFLAFYRFGASLIFPLVLLGITAIWTAGLTGLFGYKINILTGLLPPLIVIIAIPNCIYMLSDYHIEYIKIGNKLEAIRSMIHKLGLVTFMINANTAFGFLTLYYTNVRVLQEFGIVAFWASIITYLLSIIILPGLFGSMPAPTEKTLRHLESPFIAHFINILNNLAQKHHKAIFAITILLCSIAGFGMYSLKSIAHIVDDLPEEASVVTDLHIMEKSFHGVMPFEIVIDTKKEKGLHKISVIRKIDELQTRLASYPEISRTLSIADAMKWSRMAYFGGEPDQYAMPSQEELSFITDFSKKQNKQVLRTLVDSTQRTTRITGSIQDIGSDQMKTLLDSLKKEIDTIFPPENPKSPTVSITGTTTLFVKANDYLVNNLAWSLVGTFAINAVLMYLLFFSFRIMWISLVPNMIPLLITAGVMGFAGIPLKPTTALIYGIAFGIAIDNSIHFLAAYRHQRKKGLSPSESVTLCLKSTGMSIIYTSTVLFTGFILFTPSVFGGTRALGLLTSATLFIALFTNLLLLPSLLLAFDTKQKAHEGGLIEETDD